MSNLKKTISGHIGIIVVIVLAISMFITSLSNFWVSYQKTYEAAGIEAVGCANITTGLLDPADIEKALQGDNEIKKSLQESINWTVDHKHIFADQYILTLDGEILTLDQNLEKQGFSIGDDFYLDQQLVQTILDTKQPQYSEIYTYGGMKRVTGYAPIFKDHDPSKEIIALSAIDFDAKIVSERTWDAVKDSFLLGLIPITLAACITIWLIRRKTKPITLLIDYAKNIADGHLNMKDISIKNKDELGQLAETLNHMAQQLRDIIQQVKINAEHVAKSSEGLTKNAQQTNGATQQIAATMQQLETGISKQTSNIESTNQIAISMASGAHTIADNAGHVSIASVDASKQALEGTKIIENTVEKMNTIMKDMNGLENVIAGLDDRSNEIDHIISIITEIADQTNLLALNAAIEAARAGEDGRGFAVVADEVRRLAEQSGTSAQQISSIISTIKEETTKAVQLMDITKNGVEKGISAVHVAGDSFEQINRSVNDVSKQIQDVSSAVQEMAAGTEQLEGAMQHITDAAEAVSEGTKEIASSTEQKLQSVEGITSSINKLTEMTHESKEVIGKFKL
ncbi:methyl-accepting chemotaxis protein [Virgibacillus soli]|uniref:methyl-accepting chemotaxis protein n=1 Tax=Paracerasibacillus soli TaxID=480284 RepID=UPI0035E85F67